MSAQWWGFIMMTFLVCFAIVALLSWVSWDPNTFGQQYPLINDVMQGQVLNTTNIIGLQVPIPNTDFFTGLFQMSLWNFPMFDPTLGDFAWVRYFLLMPLSLIIYVMLAIQFLPSILFAMAGSLSSLMGFLVSGFRGKFG